MRDFDDVWWSLVLLLYTWCVGFAGLSGLWRFGVGVATGEVFYLG